jgi:MFS transporter, ACS family, D-galactonate transporter
MATGRTEGGTARNEGLLEAGRDGTPMVPYRPLWSVLLLGWVVSYADRTRTGPLIPCYSDDRTLIMNDTAVVTIDVP